MSAKELSDRPRLVTLREARDRLELSLEEVAKIVDVSARSLERYEGDSSKTPCNIALKLFRLYGVLSIQVYIGKEADL